MRILTNKKLIALPWRTFETYPEQGTEIMLHAAGINTDTDKMEHRFVKIGNFNAVSFNVNEVVKRLMAHVNWKFSWLPISEIEE